jgi:DNA end-binding protein Ku
MPRSIWKGAISFGLVNIPVGIYTAESQDRVRFRLLDRRSMSVIHEQRLNDRDEPVPQEEIVKGYEFSEGQFVTLTDDDFQRANPKATQTIDIVAFVDAGEIAVVYYDKPYYLTPTKAGRKPYALLRETLRRSGRVAVAKVVIRTRQYLAILAARDDVIVLELLRYAHELRQPNELEVPGEDLAELGVTAKEVALAGQLVEAMVETWYPEQYRDDYREDLLRMIDEKVAAGGAAPVAPEPEPERRGAEVIDIMGLLKRSVQKRAGAVEEEATDRTGGRHGERGGRRSGEKPAGEGPAGEESGIVAGSARAKQRSRKTA